MENKPTVKFMNDPPRDNRIAEVLALCFSVQFGMEVTYTVRAKKEEHPEAV